LKERKAYLAIVAVVIIMAMIYPDVKFLRNKKWLQFSPPKRTYSGAAGTPPRYKVKRDSRGNFGAAFDGIGELFQ
jgi:hypothetical protein